MYMNMDCTYFLSLFSMPYKSYLKTGLRIFIYVLVALTLLGTLLPLLPHEAWYIRVWDFPRLQLFGTALLALILFAAFIYRRHRWQHILIFFLLAAMVYQAYRIFPYTPLSPYQVLQIPAGHKEKDQHLSLLVSNVYMDNEEYAPLLREIGEREPDIVLTLETDKKWQQALNVLKEEYPYTVEVPLDNTYGMLLHSRLPLSDTEVRYLVEDDIPSITTLVHLPSGKQVQLYCVHPRPPVPGEQDDSKERDAEIVLIGKEAKESALPVIVAGDFNDVAWSPTTRLFQEASSLLDPRIGRGFYNTFNANYVLLRWPLDHIFHSSDFKLIGISRLPHVDSDHFPIYIDLQLDPRGPMQQLEPEPDEDTEQEANETIEEGS